MNQPKKLPLITRKMMNRFVIGLFSIAILITVWNVLKNIFIDPDFGSLNSAGCIAAIEDTANGTQAVMVKPNGEIVRSPDYTDGQQDEDIVWQPDGNRLFFSSDRDPQKAFHIFRWNPAENVVQDRSNGSRSQQKPTFPIDNVAPVEQNFLAVSGGVVVDFNPKTAVTHQQIPIVTGSPTEAQGDQGVGSQFGPEFDNLGTSFRVARWCKDKKYIVGVMERESGGETLVLQNMQPSSAQGAFPIAIVAGDHIDFTINPKTGNIIYAVQNWRVIDPTHPPKQFVHGNKIVPPFTSAVVIINPENPRDPQVNGIVLAAKGEGEFGSPTISPDGSRVALIFGTYNGGIQSSGILVCPLAPGGGSRATPLVKGPCYSPAWNQDGRLLGFTQTGKSGKSDIWTINSNGGNLTDLTNGVGDFTDISFSPQAVQEH